jgi:hypothetical protein
MRHSAPAYLNRSRGPRAVVLALVVGSVITFAGFGAAAAGAQPAGRPAGYVLAAADGGVFAYGRPFEGSAATLHLRAPITGVTATPDGRGYWLVAADGGVFSFGDAHFFGSLGGLRLRQRIVGIAATADGAGYWLLGSDGAVFSFGDARFFGPDSLVHPMASAAAIAATGDGGGYWILTATGAVRAFGDAFEPSEANGLQFDVDTYVGIAPITGTPHTFAIVGADGIIGNYGGELHGCNDSYTHEFHAGVVAIAIASACGDLLTAASDGRVFAVGVPFLGSAASLPLNAPIVGIAD